MRFGTVPVAEAAGGILAHQLRAGGRVFRKSHVLVADDCTAIAAAGIGEVTVARLEPGDIGEDEAARRLAESAAGAGIRVDPAFTGRANLFADHRGLFVVDAAAIDAFHAIDPGMTIATVDAFKRVEAGEMVATVKIIPFAVPEYSVRAGGAALAMARLRVAPYGEKRVAMLSMRLPGLKEGVIDKTARITEARLAAFGSSLVVEKRLDHSRAALDAALAALDPTGFDLLLIFGAAAIADRGDIIPAAIEAAGGHVVRFGMPVDPGNLLLLAELHGKPVIGAPGCARSPRENGFDWVLARLCADIPVRDDDIRRMGVGGLLMEIVSRPQPRAGQAEAPGAAGGIAAIVLAAGRSMRFGAANKLIADYRGRPMLRHVVENAAAAGFDPVLVVTGHEADQVEHAAGEGPWRFVPNPDFAAGLATSLRAGLRALPETAGHVAILLGDMPAVRPETLAALRQAAAGGAAAAVPTFGGHWGNPVMLGRSYFEALKCLAGDQGARRLLEAARDRVTEVPVDDPAVLLDFDTREALAAADQ